jgi:hypothetical protein
MIADERSVVGLVQAQDSNPKQAIPGAPASPLQRAASPPAASQAATRSLLSLKNRRCDLCLSERLYDLKGIISHVVNKHGAAAAKDLIAEQRRLPRQAQRPC